MSDMSVRCRVARTLLLALALGFGAISLAGPASAERVCSERQVGDRVIYECVDTDDGEATPGSGASETSEPPCELEGRYDELCIDKDACWMNDPAAVQNPEELEGTPKPDPDSYVVYIECQSPDGTIYDRWYWNDDVPAISLEDRIVAAIGELELPTIEASFNPPTRTLVNLPTWWWAEGASADEIRGSEALGMVAVAAPRGLSIDPGDGRGSIECPMAVEESDACSYEYRRSGDYTATVSIVYDISFELGGQPLPIADVPAEFRTITVDNDVEVPVREVQSTVTELG